MEKKKPDNNIQKNTKRILPDLFWKVAIAVLFSLDIAAVGFFAYLVSSTQPEYVEPDIPTFPLELIQDKPAPPPIPETPYMIINEECFLDRNRDFHLTCQVVPKLEHAADNLTLENIDVGYYMYGYESDDPYSVFSAFTDENGFVDVIVDFPGLCHLIDEDHILDSVDKLRTYDTYAINTLPVELNPAEHIGETEFARNNWIQNNSWYIVDYRSYGSRASAARHSGHSDDPAVVSKFTWVTHPQYGTSANADGTANYWGEHNWIIVHDYSWMGQVWLTMCPGMIYYIDGVEYEAEGVFNIDRNNYSSAVYDITGYDPLIIQTCDGWVYVRIIYGYPTDHEKTAGQPVEEPDTILEAN